MTAYLWMAIVGLLMFGGGIAGHLMTTQIVEVQHTQTTLIQYFDKEKGWVRTLVDNAGDANAFWSEHKIVPK